MDLNIIGLIIGFSLILILNSKKIKLDMWVSLLIGSLVIGLFSISTGEIFNVFLSTIQESLTIRLFFIILLISGLGYILKETGDFDKMIKSLIAIIKNTRILTMVIPALIGTLSIPGGAILSAPMIEESGDRINLRDYKKTTINLFYRHIFIFIYPLVGSIILTSEMFGVSKFFIIKYNFPIMVVGSIVGYFVFFNKNNSHSKKINDENPPVKKNIIKFFYSFLPIFIIIFMALILKIPFIISIIVGIAIALGKNMNKKPNRLKLYFKRLKDFVLKGINYNMGFLIIGIMFFKSILRETGAVSDISMIFKQTHLPLFLLIIIMGYITGYLSGMTSAGLGILIPIFKPMIPQSNLGPFIALLYTSIFMGYLVSPLHLCFALTKEYFDSSYKPVYRLMIIPTIAVIGTAVIQLFL